jgi:ATP-dependent DNA helicase RecG
MEDHVLESLLTDLESDRVERKETARDKERICQAVCAFANDLPDHRGPGILFIGVRDDGSCAGLPISDELLRDLAGLRTDHQILPFPNIVVQKRRLRDCELAVLLVHPADAPPVRYKGQIWIRVGPRRAVASADEERRLNEKRRFRDLPFDLRPFPSATLEDLDIDMFRRVYLPSALPPDILENSQRSDEQQLASLRLLSLDPVPVPTTLGLLVIGKDPLRFLPGAYIQFLRIDGTAVTDPIKDRDEIDGPLSDLLRLLEAKLKAHIAVSVGFQSGPEVNRPDYPLGALRQLAFNAVLHRNYEGTNAPVRFYWFDDRIEIHSPGGPYGQVTRSNFGIPGVTDYRNPHLAEAMRNLGYVQKFGAGIPIAREELRKNGNPPPEFQAENTHVLVTIRRLE